MWSALKNVGSMVEGAVESGLSNANRFLERLDRAEDEGEEVQGPGEEVQGPGEEVQSSEPGAEEARHPREESEQFFTPLRGPSSAKSKKRPSSKATRPPPGGKEPPDRLEQDFAAMRRRTEELEALLEEREAALAHIKKVAVPPRQHKESLRSIELLRQELSELRTARAGDEQRHEQERRRLSEQLVRLFVSSSPTHGRRSSSWRDRARPRRTIARSLRRRRPSSFA